MQDKLIMKKLIVIGLMIVASSLSAGAYQYNQYGSDKNPQIVGNQQVKLYNQYGSYQGKVVPISGGRSKVYNSTGSYQGYYKVLPSGRIKYYSSK